MEADLKNYVKIALIVIWIIGIFWVPKKEKTQAFQKFCAEERQKYKFSNLLCLAIFSLSLLGFIVTLYCVEGEWFLNMFSVVFFVLTLCSGLVLLCSLFWTFMSRFYESRGCFPYEGNPIRDVWWPLFFLFRILKYLAKSRKNENISHSLKSKKKR